MKIRTILVLAVFAIALTAISLWMGHESYTWLPPQASAESQLIDDLFSFLVAVGTFIFFGVVGTLTYSVLFQRAGKYDESDGPPIEGNVTLEIVWTAIPLVLVIWIAGYSYQVYDRMSILGPMEHIHLGMASAEAAPMENPGADTSPMPEIEVISRQWAWEFHYPDQNITSTELHLPNHQRVKLILTSEDVIHGFYIPAFRLKQDIIPGKRIEFEFTPIREGKYRLRDSQYSGTYFAAMEGDVVVESPVSYQEWLAETATHSPTPAYNQAFAEYTQSQRRAGWQTIVPAPPPLVNYSTSQPIVKSLASTTN
ncbi:MAG TPA: cytochrome C oxidase subunit II [Cyanobacteria bacterium UBA11149]|nr:cytochrome C oxidase subunit II [Cyanobacteria bacterium UBA11367]HBE56065.1 cytochrome C oxidase subunit II [Cyanobacteria bacterium UBA11366]HBK64538.1 cytochrome C oxidase subunit II [Cyanobacteria bacterium UBA11166]HBR73741.1 cytochrome C oxidase subunit II [Cyanobacteria bacterium UBA11159]HBS70977.1 cytochrome C oxidase subunit II [Cyanobacteria bacterium UBA11153]HBW92350.1 cytochrome C oxidase subunit II [Cyanobacteria bacterium UBA11149]HCA97821.1 cytochrome C oxidase subunit II 